MGVIAAVKEALEISPRSFAAAATAVRTILLESGWNRSCLWKRHKSISGSYDEPRHTKQKRGGEGYKGKKKEQEEREREREIWDERWDRWNREVRKYTFSQLFSPPLLFIVFP